MRFTSTVREHARERVAQENVIILFKRPQGISFLQAQR